MISRAATLAFVAMAASTAVFAETMVTPDTSDVHAPADVNAFVLDIAKPTAEAPAADNIVRAVTLGRNEKGEAVVTSIQALRDDQSPTLPAGTVAVMLVRHKGTCQPPHGHDADSLMKGVVVFVVDHNGNNVWELGYAYGIGSNRLVKGANDFGPAEEYNVDPARYREYACDKYP